jgi:hypothetical protein
MDEQEEASDNVIVEKPAGGGSANNTSSSEVAGKVSSKRTTINLIIISFVFITLLLAVVYVPGMLKKQQAESTKYNNFEFVKQDGIWFTIVNKGDQPFSLPFYYHPKDLEGIVVDSTVRDRFFAMRDNNGSIFITLDPDSSDNKIVIAGVEIAKITGQRFGLLDVPTHSAFTKLPTNATANTGTPVRTCNDANDRTLIVWIAVTNKDLVTSKGNCILLEAKSYNDTVKVADRLMYHLLGIMN